MTINDKYLHSEVRCLGNCALETLERQAVHTVFFPSNVKSNTRTIRRGCSSVLPRGSVTATPKQSRRFRDVISAPGGRKAGKHGSSVLKLFASWQSMESRHTRHTTLFFGDVQSIEALSPPENKWMLTC